jgi:hypothetical protein
MSVVKVIHLRVDPPLVVRHFFSVPSLVSRLVLPIPFRISPLPLPALLLYPYHPSSVPPYRPIRSLSLSIPITFFTNLPSYRLSSPIPFDTHQIESSPSSNFEQFAMPAIRNTPLKSQSTTLPSSNKSAPGWSKDQKSTLFNHVLKFGEKDWKVAVPGKTGHQVSRGVYCG